MNMILAALLLAAQPAPATPAPAEADEATALGHAWGRCVAIAALDRMRADRRKTLEAAVDEGFAACPQQEQSVRAHWTTIDGAAAVEEGFPQLRASLRDRAIEQLRPIVAQLQR